MFDFEWTCPRHIWGLSASRFPFCLVVRRLRLSLLLLDVVSPSELFASPCCLSASCLSTLLSCLPHPAVLLVSAQYISGALQCSPTLSSLQHPRPQQEAPRSLANSPLRRSRTFGQDQTQHLRTRKWWRHESLRSLLIAAVYQLHRSHVAGKIWCSYSDALGQLNNPTLPPLSLHRTFGDPAEDNLRDSLSTYLSSSVLDGSPYTNSIAGSLTSEF